MFYAIYIYFRPYGINNGHICLYEGFQSFLLPPACRARRNAINTKGNVAQRCKYFIVKLKFLVPVIKRSVPVGLPFCLQEHGCLLVLLKS